MKNSTRQNYANLKQFKDRFNAEILNNAPSPTGAQRRQMGLNGYLRTIQTHVRRFFL